MVVANLGEKPTVFGAKTECWSVTLLLLRKLRVVSNISLSAVINVGDLSAFVTEG